MAQREGTLSVPLKVAGPGPAKHRRYLKAIRARVARAVLKHTPISFVKISPGLNERLRGQKVPRCVEVSWKLVKAQRKGRSWEEAFVDC